MRRTRHFYLVSVLAVMAGLALVLAACQSEPTPTPTPPPTATPTATPVPPTPTPAPMALADIEITDATTAGDIFAAFSEEERTCIEGSMGSERFNMVSAAPAASLSETLMDFPIMCLSEERTVELIVTNIAIGAGGLSSETRRCITDIGMDDPGIFGMGPPPESPSHAIAGAVRMQLCMTDEEAAEWAERQGAGLPSPSQLRCLEDQLGGEEELIAMLTDEEQAEDALANLIRTAMSCGSDQTATTPTAG